MCITVCISAVERLIREHCHIDGDDLINYEGRSVVDRELLYSLIFPNARVHQQYSAAAPPNTPSLPSIEPLACVHLTTLHIHVNCSCVHIIIIL